MASLGDIRKVTFFFSVLVFVAIIAVLLHAHSLLAAGTSLMWSLACLSSGGAVGFLFGIPKVLQERSLQCWESLPSATKYKLGTDIRLAYKDHSWSGIDRD